MCKKEKLATEFYPYNRPSGGLQGHCKDCHRIHVREWSRKNPHKGRAREIKRRYGITMDVYDALLREQHGLCAICGRKEKWQRNGKSYVLSVDHDHATKKVRGLLCRSCNSMIGYANENPQILERAIAYLKSHS